MDLGGDGGEGIKEPTMTTTCGCWRCTQRDKVNSTTDMTMAELEELLQALAHDHVGLPLDEQTATMEQTSAKRLLQISAAHPMQLKAYAAIQLSPGALSMIFELAGARMLELHYEKLKKQAQEGAAR
jgi:hypothetical protein